MAGRVLTWVGSVIGFGFAALMVLSTLNVNFLDCSIVELHESAHTGAGWTIAVISGLAPVGVAVWLTKVRHWLPWLAIGVAALELATCTG